MPMRVLAILVARAPSSIAVDDLVADLWADSARGG